MDTRTKTLPSNLETEVQRYRVKARQYRGEAARESNVHMKAALESIARGYDVRADKMKALKDNSYETIP